MKKLIAVLISLAMLLAFAACGASTEETTTDTTAETTAETEATTNVVPDDQTGMFEILAENNEDVDLRAAFGSSIAETGSQMLITPDGSFDFDIGATGGSGTVAYEDGVLVATYNDRQEGAEQTCTLVWNDPYYVMTINDVDVKWSLTRESSDQEMTDVIPETRTGMYEILAENNENVDLRAAFGSSYAETGAQMTISPDGYFDFNIGATGGTGSIVDEGDKLVATYNDSQEGSEQTCTLIWNAPYYVMTINGVDVTWSLMQES